MGLLLMLGYVGVAVGYVGVAALGVMAGQRRMRPRDEHAPSGRMVQGPSYGIADGAIYDLPVVLPRYVQELGPKAVQAHLAEASAQQQSMAFQFDPPYRSMLDGPYTMPVEDPLSEWAYSTRVQVLTNCHAVFQRNPIAKQAVNLTRQFAVGKGHTLTVRNKLVQEALADFCANDENAVREYDKTFIQDLQVDGELFVRVFEEDGEVVIVPIPPWHITEIRTAPQFFRRVEAYHLQYTPSDGTNVAAQPPVDEWVPASQILHVAINRHSYELRGRPDLFAILAWLRAHKEWLENRARQNKYRNALVWDLSIEGGNPAAISAKAAAMSKPPTDGSIYVHSSRETLSAQTNPIGAGDASEDGRQIKLMAAVGVGLPEYMLSDGENANLASATAQELPALWKFTDIQELMAEQVWTPIYKRVLQARIDAGLLPDEVVIEDSDGDPVLDANGNTTRVSPLEAFTVDFPDLQTGDPKTLAEALQIAVMNRWVSNETAASEMGYEYSAEQKRIAREDMEMRDRVAQGLDAEVPPDEGEDSTDDAEAAA